MQPAFLHTASGTYDRSAILARAWTYARNALAREVAARIPSTLRDCFAYALRRVWDEAKAARGTLVWQRECEAAEEAAKLLDARTREIMALRQARTVADGIDSTPRFLAEVRAIEARLIQLGA